MKLNLLFIAMDLFIILAYPVVLIYSKINQFPKSRIAINLTDVLDTDSATSRQSRIAKLR